VGGTLDLGDGDDVLINRPTSAPDRPYIANGVDQGAGIDRFVMLGGKIDSGVRQGDGDDLAWVNGGVINNSFNAGAGQDQMLWTDGLIGSSVEMGDGDDLATFRGLTPTHLAPACASTAGPATIG
jgi:hypothetical protein